MFDEDFSKIGPELDWNGDEGLKNLRGRYYRCPNRNSSKEPKQCICNRTPSTLGLCTAVFAGSLDKQFAGCSDKFFNTNNNKHNSVAAATPSSTSLICSASRNPASSNADASGTQNNYLKSFLSMHGADLQAALAKHWDNVLHLFWTGTTAGQNMILKKTLTMVCRASMTTMTQMNTLIALKIDGSSSLFDCHVEGFSGAPVRFLNALPNFG